MTTKSDTFETFLQTIGGIKHGFSDTYSVDPYSFSVDEGWYPMLQELIAKLVELGWNREVAQVKEKFGGLRFYSYSLDERMEVLVAGYERKSFKICEHCGAPGKCEGPGWFRTLCSECKKALKK